MLFNRLHTVFYRSIALLLISACATSQLHAQNLKGQEKVDSMITVLINLEKSQEKSNLLNEISKAYINTDYGVALEYGQRSLEMAEEIENQESILNASKHLSFIYTAYYLNYYEGLNHLSRALEIAEETHDREMLMSLYQDYGFIKFSMGDHEAGISYYQKAIRIAQQLKDYNKLASLYTNMADVFYEDGDLDNALDYYSRVYSLYEKGKVNTSNSTLNLSLGMYYRLTGDYDSAEEVYLAAIADYANKKTPRYEAYAYSQLAETYILSKYYYKAIDAVSEGLEIAESERLTKEKLDNYKVQISVYDSLGDYKKTYTSLIKYTKFKDSLNTSQIKEQNRKYQTNYEEMVTDNHLAQLKDEQKNHDLEIENEQLNRNIIIGILMFVLFLVVLMILRLRYIKKKEKELKVLSLATSHTTNSIVIFDKDIKVDWVNKGFEKLTGLDLDAVKGKYFLEFYNGPNLTKIKKKELEFNFSSGEVFAMELSSYHRSTDDAYWISISVTPLLDESGDIMNYVSVATDITEIHTAHEAVQESHERTILLNEIGRQITSTLSVTDIIEKVYENINKLMDAQTLGIGIYREKENDLFFPEPVEKGNKLPSFTYDLENKDRIAVKSFLENKEIIVGTTAEINAVTGSNPTPVHGGQPNSIIYIPLISKWKTMGVISIQTTAEHAYGENELRIMRALATYVAIALDNAGLYENLEERVEERTREVTEQKEELEANFKNTQLLSELGVTISSSLEFEDIFHALYKSVNLLMDAEIFGVRLCHEGTHEIEYKYEIENGKRDESLFISMDDKDNYSVWCVENDKEIFINDNVNEYTNYVSEIKVPYGEMPNSLIFYPMHADGEVVGVLTVQSFKKDAYTPYHLAFVKTLASYTSAALHNAKLYDTLEQKVEERTKELAQKNKDITSSINYAKRIQNGILPSESFIKQLLPDSFVFYRPRDIVSGDFYWLERTPGRVYFAVVDCTGHGVPGALMSIIGKNILDQAVNEKRLTDPSMILAFLRAGLRFAFGADEDDVDNGVEDGMDLGICVYDNDDRMLEFAGANINLHVVRDGEMTMLKGDKSGVSASDFSIKHFTLHDLEAFKGDKIYMSSDGFPDQFGGERSKKFSQRRFQELLLSLDKIPFEEQHDELKKVFEAWKGDLNQLDDVCVMGVRI